MLAWLSLLIGQQVLSRSLTFLLNVVITRTLKVEQLGATMALTLLESTVLFISREPLRRIAIREGNSDYVQSCINGSWFVSIPAAILFTCAILRIQATETSTELYSCLVIYCLGLIIDMISEPFFLAISASSRIPTRVLIESMSVIFRVLITFVLVLPPMSLGLMAYGWAQFFYALFKLGLFSIDAWKSSSVPSLPARLNNGSWIDAQVSSLGQLFALQSIEKYLLTEGEKLALVMVGRDHHMQGVYGIVQNLGSLIARFLFQPIEEIAALYFSKETMSHHALHLAVCVLVKVMVLIGLLGVAFGPAYSFVAIHLLYGSSWSQGTDAAQILSLYCIYILFMAINGVTEAFMFSIITRDQLKFYNVILIAFSIIHIVLSFVLVPFGSEGLILANSISMIFRISYSVWFAKTYFKMPWRVLISPALPDFAVSIAMVSSSLVLNMSKNWLRVPVIPTFSAISAHILVGIICISIVTLVGIVREKEFISQCMQLSRSAKSGKSQ